MPKLWYKTPAREYMAGLPVGNGRLAAMVLGDPCCERLALNHEWLWRGCNRGRECDASADRLAAVRELLLAGDLAEGTRQGDWAFGGGGGGHPEKRPSRVDPYQPAGDLTFRPEHGDRWTAYRRELDLGRGVASVSYRVGKLICCREVIADAGEGDCLLMHLSFSRRANGRLSLDRREDPRCSVKRWAEPDGLRLEGIFRGGLAFRVEADVVFCDGDMSIREGDLWLSGVTDAVVAVSIGTSADTASLSDQCASQWGHDMAWEKILAQHCQQWYSIGGRPMLSLWQAASDLPTDERLRRARAGEPDPTLPALYFEYGRYLLQACTLKGDLPPNLQGKWNEDLEPPWQSDLHQNINLQMNLWPAEMLGMNHAVETLIGHIERQVPHGRIAARDLYGCDGIVFPLQTDPWGRCTPESFGWATWIGAAPWLAQHLWWHWQYTHDLVYLEHCAYPVFKEIAAFYESYLIEDAAGQLQIVPSQSPENRIAGGGPYPVTLCVSSAMDVQLAQSALSWAVESARELERDAEAASRWQALIDRLPPQRIGSAGQLLEWNQEYEEVEPQHRHFSHLFGLFPGDLFDPERTPELWEAARVALERRLAAGGGHTGWSRAWVACMYARLGDGAKAWDHLMHLITDFATDSLLDLHPPRIFQIDGNFGGTAAVLAMLLQCERGELRLLPALPAAWPDGDVEELWAHGAMRISMTWRGGRLTQAFILATAPGRCVIRVADGESFRVTGNEDERVPVEHLPGRVAFDVDEGTEYFLEPVRRRGGSRRAPRAKA